MEAQRALERLTSTEATESRDGLISLVPIIQTLNPEDLVAASASEKVVKALDAHLRDASVQRWGAQALEILFRRSAMKGVADAEDAVSALVAAARANTGVEVQRWCFSALACALTLDESKLLALRMLERDAMAVLASAIHMHSESPSLLECAASLMAWIVLEGGDAAADEAFQSGCLAAVQRTLQATLPNHPVNHEDSESKELCESVVNALTADAPLQQSCVRVLWAVSEANGELGATEIAADSGLESAISILSQQSEAEVHKWCATLVQSLLAKGGALVAESAMLLNAAEALVASMAFNSDLEVLVRCTAALATLAANGPDTAVSVLEAGGLSAVEEAAAVHGLDGELGHWYHALQEAIDHCTDTDEDLSPTSP